MSALGMPNGALPIAMGGVGALTSWGVGGDPFSGFFQGYGIGAWNHTGAGTSDNPYYELDEVVVTARKPMRIESFHNYLRRVALVGRMTGMWATGLGQRHMSFNNDMIANSLKNSPGIIAAVNNYNATGALKGHYNFGLQGLRGAGLDPVEQFIGSYNYMIEPIDNGYLSFTVTNTTSFASFSYHLWPYGWNWSAGPMSNFDQTYRFIYP